MNAQQPDRVELLHIVLRMFRSVITQLQPLEEMGLVVHPSMDTLYYRPESGRVTFGALHRAVRPRLLAARAAGAARRLFAGAISQRCIVPAESIPLGDRFAGRFGVAGASAAGDRAAVAALCLSFLYGDIQVWMQRAQREGSVLGTALITAISKAENTLRKTTEQASTSESGIGVRSQIELELLQLCRAMWEDHARPSTHHVLETLAALHERLSYFEPSHADHQKVEPPPNWSELALRVRRPVHDSSQIPSVVSSTSGCCVIL